MYRDSVTFSTKKGMFMLNNSNQNINNTNLITKSNIEYSSYYDGNPKYSLRPNSALNIFRAFDYAKYIGIPINTYVTIKFIDNIEETARHVFKMVRNYINRWLKRVSIKIKKNIAPTWVYVFENPHGHLHVHWCINVPSGLENTFEKKVKNLLQKHQNCPIQDNQLNFQPVNPYTDKALANYICKGVRPAFIDRFHLHKLASSQGYIAGTRSGVSKSIGPTAIAKAQFIAQKQRHEWIKRHPDIAAQYPKPEDWDINEVVPQLTNAKVFPNNIKNWKTLLKQDAYTTRTLNHAKVNAGSFRDKILKEIAKLEENRQ